MGYLTHRFSSLTSLVMLLVLTIGTAFLFSFAMRTNAVVEGMFDDSAYAQDSLTRSGQSVRASSTMLR
ncbi:MAG TPA: hypothetical protein VJH94_05410 [Candidatus Paceibacterota bacterium]